MGLLDGKNALIFGLANDRSIAWGITQAFKGQGANIGISRAGFHRAMDISVYSFTALAQAFQPLFRPGSSLLTLTYYGAEKVAPGYNVMGEAKAALEASVRYLAYDFGPQRVRVNAISAGPIRTLAAAGGGGFRDMDTPLARM